MFRRSSVPTYRKHRASGQAIVTLPDGLGRRKDILLGPYGTKESRQEYLRIISEWESAGRSLATPRATNDITINELALAYWKYAEGYYRKNGEPTTQLGRIQSALRPLKELYGHTEAKQFGPLALKAVRERMIHGPCCRCKGKGRARRSPRAKLPGEATRDRPCPQCKGTGKTSWSRRYINAAIGCIQRMVKWGCENEMVPTAVYQGLRTVAGLRKGRSAAMESAPIRPVPDEHVEATLPHLSRQVRAMVELQLLTGMRPGEVVIMRGCDLDTSGRVWIYRPASHNTSHYGFERIIPIGPRGQEVLKPWLRLNLQEYLFQPAEAMAHFRAEQRANRKTKVQPSQANRKKENPRRRPGDRYDVAAYGKAIRYACTKAGVPLWHPHQLRHTQATRIRREFGLDEARAVLGHHSGAMAELYAERDLNTAAAVMTKLG